MTSGWWKFDDLTLRPAYPLLTGDRWIKTLTEEGFTGADAWVDPMGESLFPQAVILARAAGSRAVSAAAAPREWLVLADGTDVGDEFAGARRHLGDRAIVVARAAAGTRTALEGLLQDAWSSPDIDRHVIYFRGLDSPGATSVDAGALDICTEVLGIAQRLVAMGDGAPRLWIVTRGAEHVTAGDLAAVDQAPLWGLARVLALEHPQVWGGIVDVDGGSTSAVARGLAAIVGQAGAEDQMALRHDVPYVARLVHTTPENGSRLQLRPDATYLITGGLGNLGLKVARWLVARGARHLEADRTSRRSERGSGSRRQPAQRQALFSAT